MNFAGDPSDRDLIARALAGERAAFAAIYQRHHAIVFRFARAMCASVATAEDVVQEVFLVLMRNLARYDADRSDLPLYLYGVARNVARGAARRDRRFVALETSIEEAPTTDDPLADLGLARRVARVRKAIGLLPIRHREVLILCELHELSYEDVARVLGVPIGTVRSRLHRARRLLAERLSRPEETPSHAAHKRLGYLL